MTRVHHIAALIGGLVLLVSGAGTWWSVTSPQMPPIAFTGFDAAPLVMSLALASGAAYGAALLSGKVLRRVLGAAQCVLSAGALSALFAHAAQPLSSLAPIITAMTGLSGSLAEDSWQVSPPQTAVWLAGVGLAALALSGMLGVFARKPNETTGRFERETIAGDSPAHERSTWDELSRGADPTTE